MFSKFILAAGLAVIAGLAVANPIQKNTILERQAIAKQDTPDFCQVIGNERAANGYYYFDRSKDCQDAGIANECCLTVMKNGPYHVWTEQDRNDLMASIAEQYKKNGRFDTSDHGAWSASYDWNVFASKDPVNSEILQVWFNVIKGWKLEDTSGLGDVILQIHDGNGDVNNYMAVSNLDY